MQEILFMPSLTYCCSFKLQRPLLHSLSCLVERQNLWKNATACFQFWINLNDIFLSKIWVSWNRSWGWKTNSFNLQWQIKSLIWSSQSVILFLLTLRNSLRGPPGNWEVKLWKEHEYLMDIWVSVKFPIALSHSCMGRLEDFHANQIERLSGHWLRVHLKYI